MQLWNAPDKINKGKVLLLLTPAEFSCLPKGTVVRCIDSTEGIVGLDDIDTDTRAGHLAFGLDIQISERKA